MLISFKTILPWEALEESSEDKSDFKESTCDCALVNNKWDVIVKILYFKLFYYNHPLEHHLKHEQNYLVAYQIRIPNNIRKE